MVVAFEKNEHHFLLWYKIVVGNMIKLSQRPLQQLVIREEEWWKVFLFKENKLALIQIAGRLNIW